MESALENSPKNTFLWVLAGITVLVVGIVIGLFIGKKLYSTSKISLTPSPSPTTTTDPTANWKTYINSNEMYSIKFPSDVFLQLICPHEELDLAIRGVETVESIDMPTCSRDGRYTIEVTSIKQVKAPMSGNGYTITKDVIDLQGIHADKYTVIRLPEAIGPGPEWYTEVILQKNDKFYSFYLGKKDYAEIFGQILSTFKFTSETSVDFRKERMLTANRQGQQNQCYAAIYETARSICKSQTGFDPGPADGSEVKEWITLTDEEKAQEVLFWPCSDRVSASEAQKCESEFPDVTKKRNAYYDCLTKGVDVGKYCGDTTGYTQANNFPKDAESKYGQCMEVTRIEKETKCITETGYNSN